MNLGKISDGGENGRRKCAWVGVAGFGNGNYSVGMGKFYFIYYFIYL